MTCSPVAALAFPTADVDLDTFFDVSLDLLVVRELDAVSYTHLRAHET